MHEDLNTVFGGVTKMTVFILFMALKYRVGRFVSALTQTICMGNVSKRKDGEKA